jgi:hypothetical protein
MDGFGNVPAIHVQSSSPQTPYTLPGGFVSSAHNAQYGSGPFPPRESVDVRAQVTAKQLLDYTVRIPIPPYHDVRPGASSQANRNYAYIGSLVEWNYPPDLGGYLSFGPVQVFNPPDPDRTLNVNAESDISFALRYYIGTPVGNVLSYTYPTYEITSNAEMPGWGDIVIDGQLKHVLARVDLSWQLVYSGFRYVFAILEFKRPGSIKWDEWAPATRNLPVGPSARIICQQLVKYAHTHSINKVAVCDGITLVLLHLHGVPSNWYGATDSTVIGASYRRITDQTEMKRHLYVFMWEAMSAKLSSLALQQ